MTSIFIPKLIIRNDRFFFQITGNAAAINKTNAVPSIRNSAPNKNTKYKIALIKGSTIALLRIHSIETLMLFRKSGCYTSQLSFNFFIAIVFIYLLRILNLLAYILDCVRTYVSIVQPASKKPTLIPANTVPLKALFIFICPFIFSYFFSIHRQSIMNVFIISIVCSLLSVSALILLVYRFSITLQFALSSHKKDIPIHIYTFIILY